MEEHHVEIEKLAALASICDGTPEERSALQEEQGAVLYDQPYTYVHPRTGRWAYARREVGWLFVAVRASNSTFPVNPKDIDRHLAIKRNPDLITEVGQLRLWTSQQQERAIDLSCEVCDGSGEVDYYMLEKRARRELLEEMKEFWSADEIDEMEEEGALEEEVAAQVVGEYGEVDPQGGARVCSVCAGRCMVTTKVSYARFRRTVFDVEQLRQALSMPFLDDEDLVCIYAPNCARPHRRDLERRLYINGVNFRISFKPYVYTRDDGLLLPMEEISDFFEWLEAPAQV